jgi:hypothetical protein
MARSFSALDLVQLPKLDASSAITLGTEVFAAAKSRDLVDPVTEALTDLGAAHKALQSAVVRRLPSVAAADPVRSRAADIALDASYGALFDFLSAWSKLPDHDNAPLAAELAAQIFPEGLKFVLAPYKVEWAESQSRLSLIKQLGLEASLDKLGAGPILKRLREAHKEYGEATGITTAANAEEATASVREAFDEFANALRHYIVRVAASVRKQDRKSDELARSLLAPIERWETPGAGAKPIAAPAPAPAPQPAPAPDPTAPVPTTST